MHLFDLFLPLRGPKQVASLASELTQRSCAAVWDAAQHRVLSMSVSEARGYLRAKATEVVAAKVDARVLAQRGIAPAARANIVSLAADGVVERLLNEAIRLKRTQGHRRAA